MSIFDRFLPIGQFSLESGHFGTSVSSLVILNILSNVICSGENWPENLKPYYVAKHYADRMLMNSGLNR